MVGLQGTLYQSLRSEIEQCRRKHGYTLSKLGELTGINPGSLSEILNGNPPRAMTIGQLDAFAKVFGREQGWLYELYTEECLSEQRISRPRLIPYLARCVEVGRKDCIEAAVPILLENPKNISILFALAEQLYEKGQLKESVSFYEYVIENEKDSFSDHFVMSQYRLFRIVIQGTNFEENWKAVIRFDPYRRRLPENIQLDALLQLANVCYTLHKWRQMEHYADELRELSTIVYEDELRRRKSNIPSEMLTTERHLVVYYGQSFLIKSVALEKQELYEEAKRYVEGYADLSWFGLLDEIGQIEVQKFRTWATANLYTLNILIGDGDVIPEYIQFLDDHPKEILSGLVTIVKAANEHGFSIDSIFDKFAENIDSFKGRIDAIGLSEHIQFRNEMAKYLLEKEKYAEGLNETFQCLVLSDITKDYNNYSSLFKLWVWVSKSLVDKQQSRRGDVC
ncbi:helix-turn-helix transcriptional regulator [Brevibacillus sp. Leaf182]|uniref:helix-turn-helix domain-containing protein n=1 Tax=Brevibacillus sp. Leaf182 TaxID=1736290 RepID=UPI0006F6DFA5|nr:helix-turn-helix transcriptional regulator [Brevibacillus sp. Leaf182]RAT98944.1 XRE family transcriptional regulator [Brevibacillus sp. Leaf182]